MDIKRLEEVRGNLKRGEYDGTDIMQAWLAIDELIKLSNSDGYAEFIEAVKEVIRISDRKHDAWDKAKEYLSVVDSFEKG